MNEEPRFSQLVLASGSAGRAELMRRLGLAFEQIPADIDEDPIDGESPLQLVQRLAREKAAAVAASRPEAAVIGSDQVAVFDGEPASKPETAERARAMLARYSGGEVTFLTAVHVTGPSGFDDDLFVDTTVVSFRSLGSEEIARYVALDQPLDCAGCFRIESLGPALFRQVTSTDPTALQGLPLIFLSRALRRRGAALP